jgi:glycosyltransferase involved in cell wall biosynthesis
MIGELWRRLSVTLEEEGLRFELIFVDDACPAGSGPVLAALAARDPRVRHLANDRNLGQRAAVRKGLAAANGNAIVIMDADLQDEPECIPRLLSELRQGKWEAVFAGRRGEYQSPSRMWTSRIFKGLVSWMLKVPADAGSYVAMSRRMASAVLASAGPEPYMLASIGGTGLPVRSIPVRRANRPEGQSAYSEWSRLKFAAVGLSAAIGMKWSRWSAK